MSTTTTGLSLDDAQHEADRARAAFADLEARADEGDLSITAGAMAVAREERDLAERRLKVAERQTAKRREAELVEARAAARDQLVESHRVGQRRVAKASEAARVALEALVEAMRAHNSAVTGGWWSLSELGPPEDVAMLGLNDEFVANARGEKVFLAPPDPLIVALALEVLDGVDVGPRPARPVLVRAVESVSPRTLQAFKTRCRA